MIEVEHHIDTAERLAAAMPPPEDGAPRSVNQLAVMPVADVDCREVLATATPASLTEVATAESPSGSTMRRVGEMDWWACLQGAANGLPTLAHLDVAP